MTQRETDGLLDLVSRLQTENTALLARLDQITAELNGSGDDLSHDDAVALVRRLHSRFPCIDHTRTYCTPEAP